MLHFIRSGILLLLIYSKMVWMCVMFKSFLDTKISEQRNSIHILQIRGLKILKVHFKVTRIYTKKLQFSCSFFHVVSFSKLNSI